MRGIKTNPKQKIIDAYQILLKMTDIKNVNIDDIDIGFGSYWDNGIALNDLLSWRIRLNNGTEKFYSAFTGQKLIEILNVE